MDQPSEDHTETPGEPLPPVRRSFPVPIRRPVLVEEPVEQGGRGVFAGWTVKVAIFAAGALAGIAAWTKLRPQEAPAVAVVPRGYERPAFPPMPPPPGPPDVARDIYTAPPPPEAPPLLPPPVEYAPVVAENAPMPPTVDGPAAPPIPAADAREGDGVFDMLDGPPPAAPVASVDTPEASAPLPEPPADTPPEAAPAVAMGPLEEKYLAALERSAAAAAASEKAPWQAEMERVRKGLPLAATSDGLPEALARLQAIYRREKGAAAMPAASPESRQLEFFVYANGELKFLLNGLPVTWASANAGVNRAVLDVKPGDVLGFELPSNREMAVIARAGVRAMFATSDTWEAAADPAPEFYKGGKISSRTRVYKEKSGFKNRMTYYEQVAKAHSSDYSVIWGQGAGTVGFRYIIRKVDLPERK